MTAGVTIRPLVDADLPAARLVHRRAFGAFLGFEPDQFRPGADCLGPRWRMWPDGGVVAMAGDRLVGSALMMHWGSACIIGPVTVDPEASGQGVARQLVAALTDRIDAEKFRWTGLFTHPHSPTHVRLYEENGFCMQRITAILSKAVDPGETPDRRPDLRHWALTNGKNA